MKSEKKDYINNQETTAAYYKKPNQKMIEQYLQIEPRMLVTSVMR